MEKVLIFGASSALAQATALSLIEKNSYDVCLVGHQGSYQSITSSRIKLIEQCDVTDWNSVNKVFCNCLEEDFLPSAVINCTGVSGQCEFTNMSYEEWRRVLSVNLDGAFNICQNAISFMKNSKQHLNIVLIGSAYGARYVPNLAHYCTSKAAVSSLAKVLSVEAAAYDISINTVVPAMFLSKMTEPFYYDNHYVSQLKEHFPAKELIDLQSIVRAIIFLIQEKSISINGTEIVVDGGYLNRIEGGIK